MVKINVCAVPRPNSAAGDNSCWLQCLSTPSPQNPYCTSVSSRQCHTYTVSIMSLVTFTSPSGRLRLRSPELSNATNILHRIQDPQSDAHLPHLRNRKINL